MTKILALLATSLILIGCGGGSDTPDPEPVPDNSTHIIYDQDHFDPDWILGFDTALEMHRNGTVTIDAVVISGIDIYGKAGLKYKTMVDYYGFDIPIGINHTSNMRATPDAASRDFPELDPRYTGGYTDITQFPSDNLFDFEREYSVTILCDVLKEAEDNSITYIIGGHLHNLEDIARETEICDGWNLFHAKVKRVVINTGGITGSPEMNLSESQRVETEASIASRWVLNNLLVPITMTAAFKGPDLTAGDVYLTHKLDSPQAFMIAVPTYGTYKDHGLSDNAALFIGVYGIDYYGNVLGTPKASCLDLASNNGIIDKGVENCGDRDHTAIYDFNLGVGNTITTELITQP